MQKAIIGKKVGMTQIFDESGKVIPVTVVEAGPCVVTQKKTVETDGYVAVQLGFGDVAEKKLSKPEAGHLKKAGVAPKKYLKETHGGGPVHRHAGSMGASSHQSRIFPGKIGAGQMGNEQVTIENLDVVKVDAELNMIVIHGAIPGPKGGLVYIRNTVKNNKVKNVELGISKNPQKASGRNPQKASARG